MLSQTNFRYQFHYPGVKKGYSKSLLAAANRYVSCVSFGFRPSDETLYAPDAAATGLRGCRFLLL